MIDYKETLNILKTQFEMKANLTQKEPILQTKWIENKIYQKSLERNINNKKWILHDGPPYANGDIHVGHALNKILKDIAIRYKTLNNYYCPYIPGWDTHGLPIEHALLKKGINKDPNLSISEKRDNCKDFAMKHIKKQQQDFMALGLMSDFENIYKTFDPSFEKNQLELFLIMIQKKLIVRNFKPVYWSWSSRTALAEAEIEYQNISSPSIYVSFKITKGNKIVMVDDELIIWTTTPWTIPSNLATAVGEKIEYVRVKVEKRFFIISKNRLDDTANKLGWEKYEILSSFIGKDMEKLSYKHPLYKKECIIILANYISNDNGTGLVHNAPGFGNDDYLACKKYDIDAFAPIDDVGKFTKELKDPSLLGVFYQDADLIILEKLEQKKALLYKEEITHSAAVDWRTKKPVIYRATKQWFVDLNKIQKQLMEGISQVDFLIKKNQTKLQSMIANRKEWCISRQRIWGVPIPIIYDDKNEPILESDLIKNIINILKNEGTNVWFSKPTSYFLTKKYLALKECSKYKKEKDIMDVWFDSGSSYNVLKENNLPVPADLYLEGNDQYRGWFNSSLICSVIQNGGAPYKQLISHGFVLDEKGRKMSKSLGNVIDPIKVSKEYGADVLRMWVASTNYHDDIRVSKNILTQTSEMYRRIRNTIFKFILSNLEDYDYDENATTEFDKIDWLIIDQLKNNLKIIVESYNKYDYATIIKTINLHTLDLSSWYFPIVKDSLYCDKVDDQHRRSIQTVLYLILKIYMFALAPIIPHTCEEVYTFIKSRGKGESIFLDKFLTIVPFVSEAPNNNYWKEFFKLRDIVNVDLEKLRNCGSINKSSEALVEIRMNNIYAFSEKDLIKYLNVAQVIIINDKKLVNTYEVKCQKHWYEMCQRCWNYFPTSEINDAKVCKRCDNALQVIRK